MASRSALRRLGAVSLGLAAVVGVTVGQSGAIYSDSDPVAGNSFSTGTVDIAAAAGASLTVSGMVPGGAVTAPLTITNSGTAALRYAVLATTTDGSLGSSLGLVFRTWSAGDPSCAAFNGSLLYAGYLGPIASFPLIGSNAQGPQVGDRTLSAGQSEKVCAQVHMPLAYDNGLASKSTTTTFTFAAEQTVNNTASATYAKLHTFTDDFSTADTVKWSDYGTNGVALSGGLLRVAPLMGYAGNAIRGSWDVLTSGVTFKMVGLPSGGQGEVHLLVQSSTGVVAEWIVNANGSVDTRLDTAYVAAGTFATYKQFRIREISGTLVWEASADGLSWSIRRTAATPTGMAGATVSIYGVGHPTSNDPAVTGYFTFDAINGIIGG